LKSLIGKLINNKPYLKSPIYQLSRDFFMHNCKRILGRHSLAE